MPGQNEDKSIFSRGLGAVKSLLGASSEGKSSEGDSSKGVGSALLTKKLRVQYGMVNTNMQLNDQVPPSWEDWITNPENHGGRQLGIDSHGLIYTLE